VEIKFNNPKYLDILKQYRKNIPILKPGDKAPEFYLANEKDEYLSPKDFKGKVVLLNFWFPGCTFCRIEVPIETKLIEQFPVNDFLLINICLTESKEEWLKAVNELKMKGINLYTQGNWIKQLISKYYIYAYPHYTLIDRNGIIVTNNAKKPSGGLSKDIEQLVKK